jgi:serine protease Do
MKTRLMPLVLLLLSVLALSSCGMPASTLGAVASEALLARAETSVEAAAKVPAVDRAEPTAGSPAVVADTVLDAVEAALEQIYLEVNPSVVNIQITQGAASLPADLPWVPGFPSDPSVPDQPFRQQGQGSGFVWDKAGHIVTNNHVVAGAEKITVTFPDNTSVSGEVVGTDPNSDLAVVKVDLPADQLYPVQLGDSTRVKVGQLAVAIGNPFGLDGTMTVGFVSALGRSLPVVSGTTLGASYSIPDIIQTDAPINPGNSGGVLVNDNGQVIGVPTAIESPVQANAGIGFAVPSVIVKKVVPGLIEDGRYEHPWLGVSGLSLNSELAGAMDLDTDQRGVLVIEVVNDSPAERAGLQGSDRQIEMDGAPVQVGGEVIVAIDNQPVQEFDDLVTYLVRSTNVGETVTLTVLRADQEKKVEVTLATRPTEDGQQAQWQPDHSAAGNAWLGILGLTITPEIAGAMDLDAQQQGVLVEEVIEKSPADQAGLRGSYETLELQDRSILVGGDIIVAVDDDTIDTLEDLLVVLRGAAPGQEVTLTLLRDGKEVTLDVALGERPTAGP